MVNKDCHKRSQEPHEELPERWALADVMTKLTKEEKDVILLRFS